MSADSSLFATSREREYDAMRRPARIPWWRIATTLLLAAALVIAVAAGRLVDSIIIGVLLVPLLVGAWFLAWRHDPPDGHA
jgi:hypothetical protein